MDPQAPKPPAGGRLEASFTEQQVLLEELRGIRVSFLAAEENFQSKLRAKLPLANVSFLSKGAPLTGQVPVLKEELELSHRVLILEQHPLNCVLMKAGDAKEYHILQVLQPQGRAPHKVIERQGVLESMQSKDEIRDFSDPLDAVKAFSTRYKELTGTTWGERRSAAVPGKFYSVNTTAGVTASAAAENGGEASETPEQYLRRICEAPRPAVMIFGSNSAGKSMLINALVGGKVMPSGSGHVSGRPCRLTYAPQEKARIHFCALDAGTKRVIDHPTLADIDLRQVTKMLDVSKQIDPLLRRPAQVTAAWSAQVIVELHYPFKLLATGWDLYDVPGTSQADDPGVQSFLEEFIRFVRPIPVFLYRNPSLSDDERGAVRKLTAVLGKEVTSAAELFMVSNYLDFDALCADTQFGLDPIQGPAEDGADVKAIEDFWMAKKPELERRLRAELDGRLKLLKESKLFDSSFADLRDHEQAYNFAVIGTRDYASRNMTKNPVKKEFSLRLFEAFTRKLEFFCRHRSTVRIQTASEYLHAATREFYAIREQLARGSAAHRAELEEARVILARFEQQLTTAILPVADNVSGMMQESIRSNWDAALAYARSISPHQTLRGSEVEGLFKAELTTWIKNNIIRPVHEETMGRLSAILKSVFSKQLTVTRENDQLMHLFTQHLAMLRAGPGYMDYIGAKVNHPQLRYLVAVALAPVSGIMYIFAPGDGDVRMNPKVGERIAAQMLQQQMKIAQDRAFSASVKDSVKRLIEDLSFELERRALNASALARLTAQQRQFLDAEEAVFGELNARLLQLKMRLRLPAGAEPYVLSERPPVWTGRHARLFSALLAGRECSAKQLSPQSDPEQRQANRVLFLREAHYTWLLSAPDSHGGQSQYGGLLPFEGVVARNQAEGYQILYSVMPRCTLEKFLAELKQPLPVKVALDRLILPVASALAHIHRRRLCHRYVRAESVVVTEDADGPQACLMDHGTLTEGETINGDRRPVDVWGLGLLIAEMVPRPVFVRVREPAKSHRDAFATIPQELRRIIGMCLSPPQERPTAEQILRQLEKLRADGVPEVGRPDPMAPRWPLPSAQPCLKCWKDGELVAWGCHSVYCADCATGVAACPDCGKVLVLAPSSSVSTPMP